ncbi:hypothetical protein [Caballeronia sp. SEWSISQ10-4 2]|nr:hypothetical protein [Caballeronia sp. SEWSISQ10-4 2]
MKTIQAILEPSWPSLAKKSYRQQLGQLMDAVTVLIDEWLAGS